MFGRTEASPLRAQRRRRGDLTLPQQMACLMRLEEHHVPPPSGTAPAGIQLPSFSKVTFSVFYFFSFSFFFFFLPVATSSHHLAVSCQLSCSAAFSLCCTRFNLMFPPRGVGRLSPDIKDLSCAGPICDLISSCYFHPLIIPPENLFFFWYIVFFSLEKKNQQPVQDDLLNVSGGRFQTIMCCIPVWHIGC